MAAKATVTLAKAHPATFRTSPSYVLPLGVYVNGRRITEAS